MSYADFLHAVFNDEENYEHADEDDFYKFVLPSLFAREITVIKLRFGLLGERSHTRKEIAKAIDGTIGRILEIERGVLRKLRHPCSKLRAPRYRNDEIEKARKILEDSGYTVIDTPNAELTSPPLSGLERSEDL